MSFGNCLQEIIFSRENERSNAEESEFLCMYILFSVVLTVDVGNLLNAIHVNCELVTLRPEHVKSNVFS